MEKNLEKLELCLVSNFRASFIVRHYCLGKLICYSEGFVSKHSFM